MGITCLSEVPDSLLMWSHYANNHRGFCVSYNLLALNQKLQFSAIPVLYTQERVCLRSIPLDQDALNKETMSLFIQSLTSKSPEWSYERNGALFGMKLYAVQGGMTKIKARCLTQSPSAIFVGCCASDELTSTLKQYLPNFNIPLYKMEKDPLLYRLNKISLLDFSK
ncbi:MAG: DUF2971 domain-containing protein [Subdoligranulum sp.]